jgi:predicted aspartyl protease
LIWSLTLAGTSFAEETEALMKFPAIATLCILAVLTQGAMPVRAADPIAVVPYRLDPSGWLVADVTLNGEGPFSFIIDTGATRSIVFSSLASKLGLAGADLPPHRVIGISSSGLFPTYVVGELAIGAARITSLVTVVLDDWRSGPDSPQGVIGLDFLASYPIVFDAVTREMQVHAAGHSAALDERGWQTVPLQRRDFGLDSGELFVLEAWIGRIQIDFLLDLGAGGTIVNSQAFKPRGVRRSQSNFELESSNIIDALKKSAAGVRVDVDQIRTRGGAWRNHSIVVHDASVFAELGQSETPFGLFGSDMVAGRSFALDLANDALWVGEPLVEPSRRPLNLGSGQLICPDPQHCR